MGQKRPSQSWLQQNPKPATSMVAQMSITSRTTYREQALHCRELNAHTLALMLKPMKVISPSVGLTTQASLTTDGQGFSSKPSQVSLPGLSISTAEGHIRYMPPAIPKSKNWKDWPCFVSEFQDIVSWPDWILSNSWPIWSNVYLKRLK